MDTDLQNNRVQKKELEDKAVREGGFYGINGVWNSIIKFPGDDRLYRHRVETIIVKDKKEVFVKRKVNGEYHLPGGSTEKSISDINQAINECKEEAHINVRNIESTGISYKLLHDTPNWAKNRFEVEWQGTYTDIYVAEYDSQYTGHVDKEDEDPFIRSGKWVSTKECFKFFRKEHREALYWFLKNNDPSTEQVATESYTGNYFKNKKLLRTISKNPEVERSAMEQIIETLSKSYREMSSKSRIQRERQKSDVNEIFHPVMTFDFADGQSITIAICFDDNEFSPGIATYSHIYGSMVIVYPCFFKQKKEGQIFTILHEFGHIRLNHLSYNNSKHDIFGNDKTNEYRLRMMRKGKAMYPEVNADFYAVLNGATMYSILDLVSPADYDDKYDYRFTHAELADRYSKVFKNYGKYHGFQIDAKESSITLYDLACECIYERSYLNESIDYLSDDDKNDLYDILYEYTVNKYLRGNKVLEELFDAYEDTNNQFITIQNKISEAAKSDERFEDGITVDNLFFEQVIKDPIDGFELDYYYEQYYFYRDKVESAYTNYNNYKDLVYNESSLDYINCTPSVLGKNPKMALYSDIKNTINMEITETVEDVIRRLNLKLENCDDNDKDKIHHYLYLLESLSSNDRSMIPTEKFGIPETRSYPLDTKDHVHSAIKLFSKADAKYKHQLAKNILIAMKDMNISKKSISPRCEFLKYVTHK